VKVSVRERAGDMSENRVKLEAFENEVKAELYAAAKKENSIRDPVTDGLVDIDRYLNSFPKILWILKEPWEEGQAGGWSVTRELIPRFIADGTIGRSRMYRRMACISYSVTKGHPSYRDIRHGDAACDIAESLRDIGYINVSKFAGKKRSIASEIAVAFRRNREVLNRQIDAFSPDVIITANILHLFCEDFQIERQQLKYAESAEYCAKNGRLHINAYHPSYWRCSDERYVDDITGIIQQHFAKP
jgi:hypothetical protein